MTDLNLLEDDPDEYEGRIVRCGGAEYIIGRWVATGAERIVHNLVNRRSGLSAHLIKILRDQANAPGDSRAMVERLNFLRASGVPVTENPRGRHPRRRGPPGRGAPGAGRRAAVARFG